MGGQDLVRGAGEGGAPALLADARFHQLAAVPAELEWFANLDNPRTRRAYRGDLGEFMAFVGISSPEQFRGVSRAHVLAWRESREQRGLNGASIRRKLAALSSLYEYLCDRHAVTHNQVKGVKRPRVESYEGKTPALADGQARQLLDAPDAKTLKGRRDRAILAVQLYHGLRRAELCALDVPRPEMGVNGRSIGACFEPTRSRSRPKSSPSSPGSRGSTRHWSSPKVPAGLWNRPQPTKSEV